jgi:hypothetical protein
MVKLNHIKDHLAFGVQVVKFEAVVGVQGRANVEAILGPKVPRVPRGRFCMDEDLTSKWPQRHLVEVKGPLKELPCTDLRVQGGLPEEIEDKFSLWEKQVPKVRGTCGIDASQD